MRARSLLVAAASLALALAPLVPSASAAPPESASDDPTAPSNEDPFGLEEVYDDPATGAAEAPPPKVDAPPAAVQPDAEGPEYTDKSGAEAKNLLDAQSADLIPLSQALAPPSGKKMMIAGGVVYGIGFLGQFAGWRVITRRCADTPAESVQDGDYLSAVSCGAGFAGGAVLLFFSGIPEFVGAPWVIAGATFHGRHQAFQDHFFRGYGTNQGRKTNAFVWSGAGLIAAGALSWIVSPVVAVRSCAESPRLTCSVNATTWGFNFGLAAMTAGGSLIGYGLAYRKSFNRYRMLSPVSLSPNFGPHGGGLSLQGRF